MTELMWVLERLAFSGLLGWAAGIAAGLAWNKVEASTYHRCARVRDLERQVIQLRERLRDRDAKARRLQELQDAAEHARNHKKRLTLLGNDPRRPRGGSGTYNKLKETP